MMKKACTRCLSQGCRCICLNKEVRLLFLHQLPPSIQLYYALIVEGSVQMYSVYYTALYIFPEHRTCQELVCVECLHPLQLCGCNKQRRVVCVWGR